MLFMGQPLSSMPLATGCGCPSGPGARALSTGVGSMMYMVMELALHLAGT